jgi:hypothetical protein
MRIGPASLPPLLICRRLFSVSRLFAGLNDELPVKTALSLTTDVRLKAGKRPWRCNGFTGLVAVAPGAQCYGVEPNKCKA